MILRIDNTYISPQQESFLKEKHKYVGYGGARGGGKSWVVRTKAKLLAAKYPGIKQIIVRRTYPELVENHIKWLRKETVGIARYNDRDKALRFPNGSEIDFQYCQRDADLDHIQGGEWDIVYIDEATQMSEFQIKAFWACMRGANSFPKRCYMTCNPGGQGHGFYKRIFIDREYEGNEKPEEFSFIQALVTDNRALMEFQPDYKEQLEALPPKIRDAWLYGRWDVYEGQYFEDWQPDPPQYKCDELGMTQEELRMNRQWCHVIHPFMPPKEWTIYRSYDFGYGKPFSCAWWAVDYDGRLYRILELYGCTETPNEGVHWTPQQQFAEIARIEHEHPYLKGREILGVADPSIWDGSRGESVAETAMKHGVYFSPGDNDRIPGWMQCHYRLAFDHNGFPMMYVFENCKAFIRTIPLLMYDEIRVEDLDTSMEDHVADEWRYMCMSRPIKPIAVVEKKPVLSDPLDQFTETGRYNAIQFRRI